MEGRLAKVEEGNPAQNPLDVESTGEDGILQLALRIDRERLAAAQAPDGRYAFATNAVHLDADQTLSSGMANQ